MNKQFKTIGIIGKSADPGIEHVIREISLFCQKEELDVLLDKYTSTHIGNTDLQIAARDDLGRQCDLVVVVGGDGTMLSAARTLCDYEVPLIGINLGRLGFLTDISPSEAEDRLSEILNGEYEVEERLLLKATMKRNGKVIASGTALNDIVVHKWEVAHMIETDTYINGHFVHTHRSDGIITSTPTGSTAYALSGGGPIIQPGLEALVIVPICPHTLSNRPIAIKSDSQIKIIMSKTGRNKGQATCDGQLLHEMEIGDEILIEANPRKLKLLHPKGHDYYQILRAKLHWAEHP